MKFHIHFSDGWQELFAFTWEQALTEAKQLAEEQKVNLTAICLISE